MFICCWNSLIIHTFVPHATFLKIIWFFFSFKFQTLPQYSLYFFFIFDCIFWRNNIKKFIKQRGFSIKCWFAAKGLSVNLAQMCHSSARSIIPVPAEQDLAETWLREHGSFSRVSTFLFPTTSWANSWRESGHRCGVMWADDEFKHSKRVSPAHISSDCEQPINNQILTSDPPGPMAEECMNQFEFYSSPRCLGKFVGTMSYNTS